MTFCFGNLVFFPCMFETKLMILPEGVYQRDQQMIDRFIDFGFMSSVKVELIFRSKVISHKLFFSGFCHVVKYI